MVWTVECLLRSLGRRRDLAGMRLVSYLPMAHIAERMTSHYQAVHPRLRGHELPRARAARRVPRARCGPNLLFGVPRVWEKIARRRERGPRRRRRKKAQFDEAIAAAKPIAIARSWDEATDEQNATWDFLHDVAFRRSASCSGSTRCDLAITGAAPIPVDLLEWYRAIGVPLPRSTACPRPRGR